MDAVRAKVRHCDRACWMIGSVSPAMHKYIWKPGFWVLTHKLKALFTKTPYSMYELKVCRDYRDGRVTKEELDLRPQLCGQQRPERRLTGAAAP